MCLPKLLCRASWFAAATECSHFPASMQCSDRKKKQLYRIQTTSVPLRGIAASNTVGQITDSCCRACTRLRRNAASASTLSLCNIRSAGRSRFAKDMSPFDYLNSRLANFCEGQILVLKIFQRRDQLCAGRVLPLAPISAMRGVYL